MVQTTATEQRTVPASRTVAATTVLVAQLAAETRVPAVRTRADPPTATALAAMRAASHRLHPAAQPLARRSVVFPAAATSRESWVGRSRRLPHRWRGSAAVVTQAVARVVVNTPARVTLAAPRTPVARMAAPVVHRAVDPPAALMPHRTSA
jgi:hypothetical protein